MSGSEKNLWDRMRKGMSQAGDFRRIECTVTGTPDVNYCIAGAEGWIELKQADRPARDTTQVLKSQHKVTPEQVEWIMIRRKHRGRAFVFVQVGKALFLFDGLLAPQINAMTYPDMMRHAQWQHVGNMTDALWSALIGQLIL